MKPYKIDVFSFTNQGLRKSNEDRSYYSQIDENTYLLLIADGMGGYADGHLAAEAAIEEVANFIKTDDSSITEQKIEFAFLKAHRTIKERLGNAGATLGGVLTTLENIFIFWAGDIKIALINDSGFFTSKEHTLLNVLKEAQITIKPEEINRLTHTVVRSVGGSSKTYLPEVIKFERNETFKGVLYSDGMLLYYSNEEIFKLLTNNSFNDLKEKLDVSIFNHSEDNVTGMFFFSK